MYIIAFCNHLIYKNNVNLSIIASLVFLDQATKFIFKMWIHEIVPITSFLSIQITHNHGLCLNLLKSSFGLFLERNIVKMRFVATVIIFIFFHIQSDKKFTTSKILLQSGSICNFLDGFIYGYVIDLFAITLSLSSFKWIIFCINFADIYNAIGTALFCFLSVL